MVVKLDKVQRPDTESFFSVGAPIEIRATEADLLATYKYALDPKEAFLILCRLRLLYTGDNLRFGGMAGRLWCETEFEKWRKKIPEDFDELTDHDGALALKQVGYDSIDIDKLKAIHQAIRQLLNPPKTFNNGVIENAKVVSDHFNLSQWEIDLLFRRLREAPSPKIESPVSQEEKIYDALDQLRNASPTQIRDFSSMLSGAPREILTPHRDVQTMGEVLDIGVTSSYLSDSLCFPIPVHGNTMTDDRIFPEGLKPLAVSKAEDDFFEIRMYPGFNESRGGFNFHFFDNEKNRLFSIGVLFSSSDIYIVSIQGSKDHSFSKEKQRELTDRFGIHPIDALLQAICDWAQVHGYEHVTAYSYENNPWIKMHIDNGSLTGADIQKLGFMYNARFKKTGMVKDNQTSIYTKDLKTSLPSRSVLTPSVLNLMNGPVKPYSTETTHTHRAQRQTMATRRPLRSLSHAVRLARTRIAL